MEHTKDGAVRDFTSRNIRNSDPMVTEGSLQSWSTQIVQMMGRQVPSSTRPRAIENKIVPNIRTGTEQMEHYNNSVDILPLYAFLLSFTDSPATTCTGLSVNYWHEHR